MTTLKNFGFAFVLALGTAAAGCAASQPGDPGEGSGSNGSGSGSGSDDTPKPLDATGKYSVQSTFDISTNMPGTVGAVTNAFIDATDSSNDPADWVLKQIIAQMPNGTVKSVLNSIEPFAAGYLNDQLLNWAPDFVTTIVQVGNDFGDMAKHFGLNEQLDVAKAAMDYSSTVTANGVHFHIDGTGTQDVDILFKDYQIADVVAMNVPVQIDLTGKLTIADHKLPISYGKVLRIGLDTVIIPLVDPNATNLAELLADLVDCQAVGQYIDDAMYNQFGFSPGQSFFAGACTAGLQFGAQALYQKISDIDASALEFGLNGTAKGVDTNKDGKMDAIQTGKWAGTLSYSGTPAPLAAATFVGSRM